MFRLIKYSRFAKVRKKAIASKYFLNIFSYSDKLYDKILKMGTKGSIKCAAES